MCEQCLAKTMLWNNQVLPGFYLVMARQDGSYMKKDWYGLVTCNDPEFVFSVEPQKDPLFGFSDDEINNISEELQKADDEWVDKLEDFALQMTIHPRHYETGKDYDGSPWISPYVGIDVMTSYKLYQACLQAGWKPQKHGENLYAWLFHHIACHIENNSLFDEIPSREKTRGLAE